MLIRDIVQVLEQLAPPGLQESYDNAGLITGQAGWECRGIICSLDATEAVVQEAIQKGCNMIVAHHPIVFGGLKKINGKNYVEKTVIAAIKSDIAIYAIHTNLDNVLEGVSGRMASLLGLQHCTPLQHKPGSLKKIYTFVPLQQAGAVRDALFAAGGGHIGNYSGCSFNTEGTGTFKGATGTKPFAGSPGIAHEETEIRVEMVFPAWKEAAIIRALKQAHPYEEVAFDLVTLQNEYAAIGSGLVGELAAPMQERDFLAYLATTFKVPVVRHTALLDKPIHRVALCGGAGSFLINNALGTGADIFVTADIKYHDFFDANDRMIIADIGHYESEQFTVDLLFDILREKFPTFAVLKTGVITNPVHYFTV
jgi:dinuclear metal center YbgI/SA1388 family protein